MKLDCSQLRAYFDNPMGANESARQAGSNNTMPDPEIKQNCFTVSRLLETFYILNNRKSLEFRYDPTSTFSVKFSTLKLFSQGRQLLPILTSQLLEHLPFPMTEKLQTKRQVKLWHHTQRLNFLHSYSFMNNSYYNL